MKIPVSAVRFRPRPPLNSSPYAARTSCGIVVCGKNVASIRHAGLPIGDNRTKWAGNLFFDRQQHGRGEFGGALALRHQFDAAFAAGIEAQGCFQRAEGTEIIAAAYWEHEQSWGVKLGLGARKDEQDRFAPMARVGLVIRIRD